jgi:hypothetical protein
MKDSVISGFALDSNNALYAANWQGAFKSEDKGQYWTLKNSGFFNFWGMDICIDKKGNIYLTGRGVYKSSDKGETFESLGMDHFFFESCAVGPNNEIFITSCMKAAGIFYTDNEGKSWKNFNDTLMKVFNLGRLPLFDELFVSDKGTILAAFTGGLIRSTDHGLTWEATLEKTTSIACFATNRQGHIFGGARNCDIYRSTNDGESWEQVFEGKRLRSEF